MGEGVFGHISKGPVHKFVDALVNDPTKRAQFLADLKGAATGDAYATILRNRGMNPGMADYLRTRWYTTGPSGMWPWLQPIYPTLKRGLIKAIEVADETPAVPLDSYWAPIGVQVEVIVVRSARQVTRIIVTPPSMPPTMKRSKPAPMWVVRRDSTGLQQGDQTLDEVVEMVDGPVAVWRILDM
jgi:hypothetical protein